MLGGFDIDLHHVGPDFAGTFAVLVEAMAKDILSDNGGYGPVEVDVEDREKSYYGTLEPCTTPGTIQVYDVDGNEVRIDVTTVKRFRA